MEFYAGIQNVFFSRYMKCLQTGMKREAVQEERSRGKGGGHTATSDPR